MVRFNALWTASGLLKTAAQGVAGLPRSALAALLIFGCLLTILLREPRQLRSIYIAYRSHLPATASESYTRSIQRDAARIPRTLLSPSLIGISPEYASKELERDKAENGGDDHTIFPASGKSLADAWKDLKYAKPAPEVNELLPQFRGTRCLSRYPLQDCPFPGQCPPAIAGSYATKQKDNHLPCAQWATGEPLPLQRYLSDRGQSQGHGAAREHLLDWDVDGRWIDDMWHPYDPLLRKPDPFHFFTPEEVHRCFLGKRIVFQGDSLVRQLFYRVVNYLRQVPTNVEHVFDWGTSSYQPFKNGTDKWYPNCPDRQCTFPEEALYTVMFDWHNPWDPAGEFKRLHSYKSDVVVQGWNYWLAGDFNFGPLRRELAKFLDGDDEGSQGSGPWKGKLTWYLTPVRGPEEADYQEFRWRNRGMRQFVHTRRKAGQSNINILPNDYMTTNGKGKDIVRDRRPIDSSFNDVHFMADFLKSNFPEPLKPGLQNIKTPMDWDTRDVVDLNMIMVWLNGLCHPSS